VGVWLRAEVEALGEAVLTGERIEGSTYTLRIRPSGESQMADGVASAVMETFSGVYWLVRRRSHWRVYHLFAAGAHHRLTGGWCGVQESPVVRVRC
jgi:hypothetical protein